MITKEQQTAINLINDEYSPLASIRVEEQFELMNTEEYLLERIKELKKTGTVWFKKQIELINQIMTLEEAKRINKLMVEHSLHDVFPVKNPNALQGVSLYDMLEAIKILKSQPKKNIKNTNGTKSRTFFIKPDERLIAALYVANNYEGGNSNEPNLVAFSNKTLVLVISEESVKANSNIKK